MGAACGNFSSMDSTKLLLVERDSKYGYVEPIQLKPTKIEDFDPFFQRASLTLNKIIELNNQLHDSIQGIEETSALLQDYEKIQFTRKKENDQDLLHLDIYKINKHGLQMEIVLKNIMDKNMKMEKIYQNLQDQIQQFNSSLLYFSDPTLTSTSISPIQFLFQNRTIEALRCTQWKIATSGRVEIIEHGRQDDYIYNLNILLFQLRQACYESLSLHGVCGGYAVLYQQLPCILLQQENRSYFPKIQLDIKTHACQLVYQDPILGDILTCLESSTRKKLPKLIRVLIEYFMQLYRICQEIDTQIILLNEKMDGFIDESNLFSSKIIDVYQYNEHTSLFFDIRKATQIITWNCHALKRGRYLSIEVKKTIQQIQNELSSSIIP